MREKEVRMRVRETSSFVSYDVCNTRRTLTRLNVCDFVAMNLVRRERRREIQSERKRERKVKREARRKRDK